MDDATVNRLAEEANALIQVRRQFVQEVDVDTFILAAVIREGLYAIAEAIIETAAEINNGRKDTQA